MAMSMRSQGLASSTTGRPRHSLRPAYEDFRPLIESKEDPESHIVYIHLPGFVKDQIKIVAESTRGVLRVRGECFIAGNRWSRFQEEVPVPANCDITETRAKFEGGVLGITFPKRISSAASPIALSDEATTPERSPPPPRRAAPLPQPTPPRPVAHPQPHPELAAPRPVPLPPPRTTEVPPRSVTLPPPLAPRPVALPPPRTPAAETPTGLPPPNFQPKPREDAKSEQSPPLPPRPTPLPPPPQIAPIIHPRPREDEKHNFEANRKPLPLATPPAPAGMLQALPQSDPAPRKDPIDADKWRTETRFPGRPEEPLKSASSDNGGGEAETSMSNESMKENGMKAVSGRRRMEEDRQLLVNMGVAVMVLVGLGAWISYSFGIGSPPNPTN